ncbi:hypothetical protein Y032_0062g3307 [Ancylostoma ceylanicum]|uniref:Uncharacterized protein n=1 Tax=Ancylostoma ceylanicum TaxID=53326 RepID=A0A016U2E5_9BILA|nr:hypothetical protein Y032_0062g3307 [Ancylostoma ceylanicum]
MGNLYLSDARIHLPKIFHEDRSTWHTIPNKKNAWPPGGRKRVRLSCVSDATGPILRHNLLTEKNSSLVLYSDTF